MKKYIVLFFLLLLCVSCVSSQKEEIIAKSTIKLEGRNTSIRELLEIDGYYAKVEHKEIPISGSHMIFFEDGTYVAGFRFKEGVTRDSIAENMSGSIDTWIKDKKIPWGRSWGVYQADKNMIIGNRFSPVYRYNMQGWLFDEVRYKIIRAISI